MGRLASYNDFITQDVYYVYYDHALTEIEKGKLLDGIDLIKRRYANEEVARISGIKDKILLSILQDNYSKLLSVFICSARGASFTAHSWRWVLCTGCYATC